MSPALFFDGWRPGYPRDHQPRRGLAGSLPPTSTTSSGVELIGARDAVAAADGLSAVAVSAVLSLVIPASAAFLAAFFGAFLAAFFLVAFLAGLSVSAVSSLTSRSALARVFGAAFLVPAFLAAFFLVAAFLVAAFLAVGCAGDASSESGASSAAVTVSAAPRSASTVAMLLPGVSATPLSGAVVFAASAFWATALPRRRPRPARDFDAGAASGVSLVFPVLSAASDPSPPVSLSPVSRWLLSCAATSSPLCRRRRRPRPWTGDRRWQPRRRRTACLCCAVGGWRCSG